LKDFKTIQLASEVYFFAHKWHFRRLEIEAGNFLSGAPTNDLLKVYNLYLGLKHQQKMDDLAKVNDLHKYPSTNSASNSAKPLGTAD
jgi:hypothetical protein